ncbi:hypothetical protein JCM10914A_49350 [Paenibacillus sp. JCM 10914]|uniref:CD3324 family protein n=1 Tax=Paenibacillus sp. JCM 10914 TaxID=1236974 RepID=UPI0003CC70CA|nr:hypothetical protein JCM10914_5277 [Paenibacillus sp. JCM 10914]
MNYENANDILPEKLLKEVQKYAAGKLLYIPTEDKKAWGEMSGYRDQLQRRNIMIRNKYTNGMTISELADEYYLSLDSIKKIIYSKKNDKQFAYAPTVRSAVNYASVGMLEEWIQCYLLLTRKATLPLHEFTSDDPHYIGVVKLPLRLIPYQHIEPGGAHDKEIDEDITDYAPLLIQYMDGKFYDVEQNERIAALKQRKVNAYPAIIFMKEPEDYKKFMKLYGTVLFFMDRM